MNKIVRQKDDWGDYVIYVEECEKYEYENPDAIKSVEFYLHNPELKKIDDIIYKVENYLGDK